jgi:hypothetical protein
MSVQHIIDWRTGEAYFAIVRGSQIIKALRDCRNWTEAAAAFKAARAALAKVEAMTVTKE